jgi:hypothetical protein
MIAETQGIKTIAEKTGSNRKFQPRGSREYNQSPNDMLNGPCHMHYAYVDDKRVS